MLGRTLVAVLLLAATTGMACFASAGSPVAAALPVAPAGPGPGPYELHVVCPTTDSLRFSTYSRPTCPVRLVDQGQMLGDPALAVDPFDPQNLAIAMIHGGVDGSGPSVRSRTFLPFTTFTSDDAGATWDDGYFRAPEDLGQAYGEHAAAAVDPYGQVYVGSTYAVPDDGGGFLYTIGAQKFDSVQTVREEQTGGDGSYNLVYVDPVFPGGRIRQTWFLFNGATDHMTMVWHEDAGADGRVPSASAMQALPGYEARRIPRLAEQGGAAAMEPRGTIGVVWTGSGKDDDYVYQPIEWSIGPCAGSTNPVLFGAWLYIGCEADPGQGPFRWNPGTRPGQVELFRMHPDGGEPQYMGASPIVGGAAKLGVRSDGRLALLSADVTAEGTLSLAGAFGRYSESSGQIAWSPVAQYGPDITPILPGERVLRSNIQDLLYREYSGVVHLILRETIEPRDIGADFLLKSIGPKIRKSIVALDEASGVLARHSLDIGNPANRSTDPDLLNRPEMAYEDLSDDLMQLPPAPFDYDGKPLGDTYQREFFAVADYGQAIYAEIVEVTDLRFVAPPPAAAAPPVAAPATATSVSTVLVPAAGITVAALLAASFIINRRKDINPALAKFKK